MVTHASAPLADALLQQFLASLNGMRITTRNINAIVQRAVQCAEQGMPAPGSGAAKKAWVLRAVQAGVEMFPLYDPLEQSQLDHLLSHTMPGMIESMVDMYNAGQELAKLVDTVETVSKKCGCFGRH